MFRIITAFAKKSRIAKVHPTEKIAISILPIIIIGLSAGIELPLANMAVFMLLHWMCKNPVKIVCKFVLGVGIFAAVSSITFIFDYGIGYSFTVLLKCLSGGLTVSFLALTTPLDDMLYLTSKSSTLREVCDIAKSMERFLILIEDECSMLYKAVKARGGFDGPFTKIKSTGRLCGLLFINTMKRWREIRDGLNSRCYRGYMPYLKKHFEFSTVRFSLICLYNLLLIVALII